MLVHVPGRCDFPPAREPDPEDLARRRQAGGEPPRSSVRQAVPGALHGAFARTGTASSFTIENGRPAQETLACTGEAPAPTREAIAPTREAIARIGEAIA